MLQGTLICSLAVPPEPVVYEANRDPEKFPSTSYFIVLDAGLNSSSFLQDEKNKSEKKTVTKNRYLIVFVVSIRIDFRDPDVRIR